MHVGGIKDSNKRVRWVLIQATQTASRSSNEVVARQDRSKERRRVIRVANKMATIIWHILTKRQPYDQVKQALYESKLKKIARLAT